MHIKENNKTIKAPTAPNSRHIDREEYVPIEFGNQVKSYLTKFGLIEADLAHLINSNSADVELIIEGKKSVGLKKAERISNVFGRTYYDFGNPASPLPRLDDLPPITRHQISKREIVGVQIRDYDKKISEKLDDLIYNTELLHQPITAENIRQALSEDIRNTVDASRISDLLSKGKRTKDILVVGKDNGANLYQLKTYI